MVGNFQETHIIQNVSETLLILVFFFFFGNVTYFSYLKKSLEDVNTVDELMKDP